jgi:hypothetical protein
MIRHPGNMSRHALAVVVGALFTACSGGPSDSEFVAACIREGESVASQMLDKELGVTRDAFCQCGATFARSALSANGYRAMVLEMQGNREEARSLTSGMSESEQQAMVEVAAGMVEECAGASK